MAAFEVGAFYLEVKIVEDEEGTRSGQVRSIINGSNEEIIIMKVRHFLKSLEKNYFSEDPFN